MATLKTYFDRVIATLLVTICGLFLNASLCGQGRDQNPGFGNMSTIEINGELQDSNGKVMQVKKEDGTFWYVTMPQQVGNIQYQADLTPKQLQPGMMIRFRTEVEDFKAGKIATKDVTVLPPNEGSKVRARTPRDRADFTPGLYPIAQFGQDPNSREVQIVGVIVEVKDSSLVINAGQKVEVPLSEETKLQLRTSSLEFVKQGDKVEGTGLAVNQQANQVVGSRITITGELPEQPAVGQPSEPKEKQKGKRKSSRKAKDQSSEQSSPK